MISDAADRSGDHQGDAIYARLRVAASVIERGRPLDTLAELTRCVETAEHAHRYHALSLLKLGHAYEGMGRYPEAISYLEQSMAMFRQLRLPRKVSEAQQALDRCQVRECLCHVSGRGPAYLLCCEVGRPSVRM